MIAGTPDFVAEGICQTPGAIEDGVNTTGSLIAATPGVVAEGIRQTPGVIESGVETTGSIIAATPGAFVNGVQAIGNFGGAVFGEFARPFGK